MKQHVTIEVIQFNRKCLVILEDIQAIQKEDDCIQIFLKGKKHALLFTFQSDSEINRCFEFLKSNLNNILQETAFKEKHQP